MITEDYVSFETAKLLKEKGFNWGCYQYYNFNDGNLPTMLRFRHQNGDIELDEHPTAPTLQMAMKWLREIHHIGVFPSTYCISFDNQVTYPYGTCIINLDTHEIMLDDCMARTTYEEACEAAIKYCLENLI